MDLRNPKQWSAYKLTPEDQEILHEVSLRRAEFQEKHREVVRDASGDPVKRGDGRSLRYAHVLKASMGAAPGRRFVMVLRSLGITNCLELGTCGGLSSMYLYGALRLNALEYEVPVNYIGIEGCLTRVAMSSESLLRIQRRLPGTPPGTSASIIHSKFDMAMLKAMASLGLPQFVYIDGEHNGTALDRYFRRAVGGMGEGIIAIDDRTYNNGMRATAGALIHHPRVREFFDVTQSQRFYVVGAA